MFAANPALGGPTFTQHPQYCELDVNNALPPVFSGAPDNQYAYYDPVNWIQASNHVLYKVFFLGRHGEGYCVYQLHHAAYPSMD